MALEFVAKNGLISKNNVFVSGSLIATSLSGSHFGTSSVSITSSFTLSSSYSIQSSTSSFLPNTTYAITSSAPNTSKAWARFQTIGGALIASQSFNCNLKRLATGSIGVTFISAMHDVNYTINFNGVIGSTLATSTGSFGFGLTQTTLGFTCSTVNITTPGAASDCSTGSLLVFGY